MDLMPFAFRVAVFYLILLFVGASYSLLQRSIYLRENKSGDLVYKRGNFTCVDPLVSLWQFLFVISVILNILLVLL